MKTRRKLGMIEGRRREQKHILRVILKKHGVQVSIPQAKIIGRFIRKKVVGFYTSLILHFFLAFDLTIFWRTCFHNFKNSS